MDNNEFDDQTLELDDKGWNPPPPEPATVKGPQYVGTVGSELQLEEDPNAIHTRADVMRAAAVRNQEQLASDQTIKVVCPSCSTTQAVRAVPQKPKGVNPDGVASWRKASFLGSYRSSIATFGAVCLILFDLLDLGVLGIFGIVLTLITVVQGIRAVVEVEDEFKMSPFWAGICGGVCLMVLLSLLRM